MIRTTKQFHIVPLLFIGTTLFSLCALNNLMAQEHQDFSDTTQEINLIPEDEFLQEQEEELLNEEESEDTQEDSEINDESFVATPQIPRIHDIIVVGNTSVPTSAILSRLPYRAGEIYDPLKTRELIHRLYYDLRRFRNISVFIEPLTNSTINLHVVLEEKKILKDVRFEGNSQVTEKEILEKIPFGDIRAIDPEEMQEFAYKMKKIYIDKGYHAIDIETQFILDDDERVTAVFIFNEKPKSLIKRIEFRGNCSISGKELRSVLFSREDWILSFMDKSGTFQVDRLEADRHMIEKKYQDSGFLNAHVVEIVTDLDEETNSFYITFVIEEGNLYMVKEVSLADSVIAPIPKDFIIEHLPLQARTVYSRENVMDSIKDLEMLWGNQGYIFAHIEPAHIVDDEKKTVSIVFNIDPGDQVYLNHITIRGNKKTRDKIIRRQILLEEGGLLTNTGMETSKSRIESLGYFEMRDGVNWKVTRLDQNLADLDLYLKETRTGNANFQIGYGGTPSLSSPADGVVSELNVADTNLFGSGVRVNALGRLSKEEKTVVLNVTQPWLFDYPIHTALDAYHKRVSYDEFNHAPPVNEQVTGGVLNIGCITGWAVPQFSYFKDTLFRASFGIESLRYGDRFALTQAQRNAIPPTSLAYFTILRDKLFPGGNFGWLAFTLSQDTKNHPMHPSKGQVWNMTTQFSFPISGPIGFSKVDLDYHWFTPLIGNFDLVFHVHGHLGAVKAFKGRVVPYRELYHIGGPASVRGFTFGQISPRFAPNGGLGDSIGGSKTLFFKSELIFPIRPDMSLKALVFYDGGAGWDNPYCNLFPPNTVINNNFDYRHAVGVGFRMLNPTPIRVDVGFKLDPRRGEPIYEVHFGMTYDWA